MIKRLICKIWGHQLISLGIESDPIVVRIDHKICRRCGEHYRYVIGDPIAGGFSIVTSDKCDSIAKWTNNSWDKLNDLLEREE
jgi:hypothetical protein